jgi:serine/threonine protein kinase
MHGDLSCSNILLNEDHTSAKIGDLGLSRHLQIATAVEEEEDTCGGTLPFAAPETLMNMPCDIKVRPLHTSACPCPKPRHVGRRERKTE